MGDGQFMCSRLTGRRKPVCPGDGFIALSLEKWGLGRLIFEGMGETGERARVVRLLLADAFRLPRYSKSRTRPDFEKKCNKIQFL